MSKIEWCTNTWNPVVGCTRVSAGCDHCYAARMALRLESMGKPSYKGIANEKHFTGVVRCLDDRLEQPLRWRNPRKTFVCSMSDLFHPKVPFEFIDKVFGVMALCPQHAFQVLTKRPERTAEWFATVRDRRIFPGCGTCSSDVAPPFCDGVSACDHDVGWCETPWPLPNIWLGTSVEDQAAADERIPWLLKCPAAVRFLSVEPMLGPVNLYDYLSCTTRDDIADHAERVENDPEARLPAWESAIDWAIFGGESGPGARPCDVGWIRDGLRQCREAGVAAFVKQLGANAVLGGRILIGESEELVPGHPGFGRLVGAGLKVDLKHPKGGDPSEWPEDLRVREWPEMETADV